MRRKESEVVPEGNDPVHQEEEFWSSEPAPEDLFQRLEKIRDFWNRI